MNLITGKRQTGKTTRLIITSSVTRFPIFCATKRRAEHIIQMANALNLDIPKPLTPLGSTKSQELNINDVLIDDVDDVLSVLLRDVIGNYRIVAGTVTDTE